MHSSGTKAEVGRYGLLRAPRSLSHPTRHKGLAVPMDSCVPLYRVYVQHN